MLALALHLRYKWLCSADTIMASLYLSTAEEHTMEELCAWWLKLLLRPGAAALLAAHVNVPHSRLLSGERLTAGDIEGLCGGAACVRRLEAAGLSMLQGLLRELGRQKPGRYLLTHAPYEQQCCLFRAVPAEVMEHTQVGGRAQWGMFVEVAAVQNKCQGWERELELSPAMERAWQHKRSAADACKRLPAAVHSRLSRTIALSVFSFCHRARCRRCRAAPARPPLGRSMTCTPVSGAVEACQMIRGGLSDPVCCFYASQSMRYQRLLFGMPATSSHLHPATPIEQAHALHICSCSARAQRAHRHEPCSSQSRDPRICLHATSSPAAHKHSGATDTSAIQFTALEPLLLAPPHIHCWLAPLTSVAAAHEHSGATDTSAIQFVPPRWRRFMPDIPQIPHTFPPRCAALGLLCWKVPGRAKAVGRYTIVQGCSACGTVGRTAHSILVGNACIYQRKATDTAHVLLPTLQAGALQVRHQEGRPQAAAQGAGRAPALCLGRAGRGRRL